MQSKQCLQSTKSNSSLISEVSLLFSSVAISLFFSENENFREIPIYLHFACFTNKENKVPVCLAATGS